MHIVEFTRISFVMIATVALTTLLAFVPIGMFAHAATIEFELSEPVYDFGSDSDAKFSFTGKVIGVTDADDTRLINIFVSKENGPGMLLSGHVDSERYFVTAPRLISDVFKNNNNDDGQYTATAFIPTQTVKNGTTITLQVKNNLLYEQTDFNLVLRDILDRTVTEGDTVSFDVGAVDAHSINGIKYKLSGMVHPGAVIDSNTGMFSWTPDYQKGSKAGAVYKFQVTAYKIPLEDTKTFVITVKDSVLPTFVTPKVTSSLNNHNANYDADDDDNRSNPPIRQIDLRVPAPFVDAAVDSQTYVDRYNTDDEYRQWFDKHYPEYDSIYHAVGLDDPDATVPIVQTPTKTKSNDDDVSLAPFVEPSVDPQTYVDRYNNEPSFQEWFDSTYASEYSTIYAAVGLVEIPAPFVEPSVDIQTYVDRYNNEPSYKKWFDTNYPEYDSIYHALGLQEMNSDNVVDVINDTADAITEPIVPELPPPVIAPGAVVPPGLVLQPGQEFGECGNGTELVDNYCVIIGTMPPNANVSITSDDEAKNGNGGGGGGCLIATAVYGSEMAPQVQLLREIRDDKLMQTYTGASFMTSFNHVYYLFSPHVADYERENQLFKDATRSLLTPLLTTLSVMKYADSESEILVYGIGVILLNIAMYVGMPAISALYACRYLTRKCDVIYDEYKRGVK